MVPCLGNKDHCYHNPKSLLDDDDTFEQKQHVSQENKKMVADMGQGKLSATQIQTAIFQSSGKLLSLSPINNITQYYSEGIINDNEFI